jgi:hypothetical protein
MRRRLPDTRPLAFFFFAFAFAFALVLLAVIPAGDLLLYLPFCSWD